MSSLSTWSSQTLLKNAILKKCARVATDTCMHMHAYTYAPASHGKTDKTVCADLRVMMHVQACSAKAENK